MVTRKTRLVSGLAAVLMLISMLTVVVVPAAAATAWAADETVQSTGLVNKSSLPDITNYSSAGEYKVTNRAGMDKIMSLVDAGTSLEGTTIYQMADIDMGWEPFGGIGGLLTVAQVANNALAFKGTFDGNGFTIDNLYVLRNTDVADSVGLFGMTDGAVIRNVGISGGLVVGRADVGTIVGNATDTKIHNCWSAATVIGGNTVANGGIVGYATGDTMEVVNCYNLGLVYNYSKYATGIVGYMENATEAIIANCYNAGEIVTGMNGYGDAAAPGMLEAYSIIMGADYQMENGAANTNNYYITGRGKVRSVAELIVKNNGSFSDMAETMIMSTDAATGMDAAALTDGSLAAALNTGDMTLAPVDGYSVAFENTEAGYPAIAYKKNGNTVVKRVAHESFNVNGATDWADGSELFAYLAANKDGGWAKASSSRLDNLEISTANDLFVLGLISSFCTYKTAYGNGNVTLADDIDMAEMDICPVEYFVPIASGAGLFNGTFDGMNHIIKGWKFFAGMCGGAPEGGLISRVGATTVKNVGLVDAYGHYAVEGVAGGYSYPTLFVEREYAGPTYIDNCYVIGTLKVETGATNHNNNGAVFSTTWSAADLSITNCWSFATLTGATTDAVRCVGKIPAATTETPTTNNYTLASKKPYIANESSDNGANRYQTQLSTSEYSISDGSLAAYLNNVMTQKWAAVNGTTTFAKSVGEGSYTVTIAKMSGDYVMGEETMVYTAGSTVTVPTIEGYVLDPNKPQPIGAFDGSFIMPGESVTLYYQLDEADFSLLEDIVAEYGSYDMNLFTDGSAISDLVARAQDILDAKDQIPTERAKELIAEIMSDSENITVQLKDVYPYLVPLADYEVYKDVKTNKEWAIGSVDDWKKLVELAENSDLNGWTFHFTNDVDMNNELVKPVAADGSPAFKGVIDGHDYVIKNLNINFDMAGGRFVGLIGYATKGCIVRNLGIESGRVRAYGANESEALVGSFMGQGDDVGLYKLWNAAEVDSTAGTGSGGQTTSGLARTRNTSYIENCFNLGTVKGQSYAGSLSGYVQGNTLVYNCFAVGTGIGTPCFVRYNGQGLAAEKTVNSYAVGHAGPFDCNDKNYKPDENNIKEEAYSNGELAWMLNSNYVAGQSDRVYYTLQDGKTVFGSTANATVRVTLTMEDEEDAYLYVNAGTALTLDYAAGATYKVADGCEGTIEGNVLTVPSSDTTIVASTSGLKYRSLATALEQYDNEEIFTYLVDGAALKEKVAAIRAKYEALSYETQEEVDADVELLNSSFKFGEAPALPPVTMVVEYPNVGGYMINTLEHLEYVAANQARFTKDMVLYLGADIVVTPGSSANKQLDAMHASIDGRGYAIKNLTFTGDPANWGGDAWLGYYEGAFVKNLTMEGWKATNLGWQGALLIFEATHGNAVLENIEVINCTAVNGGTRNGLALLVGLQNNSDRTVTFKNIKLIGNTMDKNKSAGNSGGLMGRNQKGTVYAENIFAFGNTLLNSLGSSSVLFGELTGKTNVLKNIGVYNTATEAETNDPGVLVGNFKTGDQNSGDVNPSLVLENVQVANNGSLPRLVYRQNTNSTVTVKNVWSDVPFGTGAEGNEMATLDILNGAGAYAANATEGIGAKWEILPGYAPSIDTDGEGLPVKVSLTTDVSVTDLYTDANGNVLGLTEAIFNSAKWDGYETIEALKTAVFTEDTVINTKPCDHEWSYVDNENGTHTMTCIAENGCGMSTTVACDYQYEFSGNNLHTKTCPDCGNAAVESCKSDLIRVPASCETPSQTLSGCDLCGNLRILSTGSTLGGHTWVYTHDDGTEGEASTHTRTCTTAGGCGVTESVPCEFDDGVYTEHTADRKGYTTFTCECEYSYEVEEEEVTHIWDDEAAVIDKYPSYVTDEMTEEEKAACNGVAKVPCSACGVTKDVVIPALTGAGIQVNVPGKVDAGDTVEITLDLVNNPGVAGLTVKVTYDAENLTLLGVENGDKFGLAQIADAENGEIMMSFVNVTNITEDGAFVTLTFQVKEDVEGKFPGEVELSKSPAGDPADTGASDYNGNYVELGGSGAFIEIADFIWGDVNDDGVADGIDAVLIMQYAAGSITLEDLAKPQAGDTNGDNIVDGVDAVLIMQYAAGSYDPQA
ncbi:MAG: hypothetical protein IJP27_05410 [Clostridia bacterium]|nr:hypothetical protein [Clostridia bacterium]